MASRASHKGGEMKKITMLNDLVRSAFIRPVTECYPVERRPLVDTYRGMLRWNPEACTGCALCVKDCPANAIELITIDKANKRFVLRFHVDRCTFCGQCEYNCRFDCIKLDNEGWELAEIDRENFTLYYGRKDDIQELSLATHTEPVTG